MNAINAKHAQYASQALQLVLQFGCNINCRIDVDGHRLDVSEVTDRDGLNLLIRHHPTPDEPFRAEARFYPEGSDDELGGRLYLYLLQLNGGKPIELPTVTTLFVGWSPSGIPEPVDALVIV